MTMMKIIIIKEEKRGAEGPVEGSRRPPTV